MSEENNPTPGFDFDKLMKDVSDDLRKAALREYAQGLKMFHDTLTFVGFTAEQATTYVGVILADDISHSRSVHAARFGNPGNPPA